MTTTSGGGTLSLIHGNALAIPLADQSVHLVVTSPPYHSLRSYRDGGEHFDGQLGSEETPHHFLAALWAVMDECWRVLRDDGNCWVNLGDRFAGAGAQTHTNMGPAYHAAGIAAGKARRWARTSPDAAGGLRPKCRMLLPGRFAHGLIDPDYRVFEEHRAGLTPTADPPQWICRMDVVQSKLNGLPESVQDRVRASHESWFHCVKSERYFAAMDEVREEAVGAHAHGSAVHNAPERGERPTDLARVWEHPLGKLPGSVWEWANEPLVLPDDLPQHFAAFASWPIRRIVSGWSPSGVCVACGQPRRSVCERTGRVVSSRGDALLGGDHENAYDESRKDNGRQIRAAAGPSFPKHETVVTGYACACPTPDAPTRPAVVVDPFSGTGTAPIVAAALGRHGIGVDLSWDYHRIARWRDRDGGLRAKALGVDRPERQVPGQMSLLDGAP